MKRILKSPMLNAICLGSLTAVYSIIFIRTSGHIEFIRTLYYANHAETLPHISELWANWSRFLADGNHQYIAYILMALTAAVVIMLLSRRRPYDEYHVEKMATCLMIAMILTAIAIALFYVSVLSVPTGIIESFTLFIVIHWTAIVLVDLVFVILCHKR